MSIKQATLPFCDFKTVSGKPLSQKQLSSPVPQSQRDQKFQSEKRSGPEVPFARKFMEEIDQFFSSLRKEETEIDSRIEKRKSVK